MRIAFVPGAWDDYLYWQARDRKVVQRINELLRDITGHPFEGIGKPEPLKGTVKGMWSRRITWEHRLVYSVVATGTEQTLVILQCRFHY